jgi:hypothetical protein
MPSRSAGARLPRNSEMSVYGDYVEQIFYRALTFENVCRDALPYKPATENVTRLRRELKAVEDEATKVSDTVVQRRLTLDKTLGASGEVTTALTRARDQV